MTITNWEELYLYFLLLLSGSHLAVESCDANKNIPYIEFIHPFSGLVECPNGSLCSDNTICCPITSSSEEKYKCCPHQNGVCCSDGTCCAPFFLCSAQGDHACVFDDSVM
nr:progranulin-like [Lepeophtheirus salmonis]